MAEHESHELLDNGNDSDPWDHIEPESDSDDVELLDLSEEQLREEYDNEEIERFLAFFASNVNEVQLPRPADTQASQTPEAAQASDIRQEDDLSKDIAMRYLLPYLPPAHPSAPFTLTRLRLTIERLWLSTAPVYLRYMNKLLKLAIWEDKQESSIRCIIYWLLWYHNLLLPALVFRIFYGLVRRRVFPYPSAKELKERQIEIDRAKEVYELSTRLTATTPFHAQDVWLLFRAFTKPDKSVKAGRRRTKVKEKLKGKKKVEVESNNEDEPTSMKRLESQDERDLRRFALQCADAIADLHERIHNLFIWRRPSCSFRYGVFFAICFVFTLLVPTEYVAKLVYLIGGILYWHVAPIVAALPPSERSRIPLPLFDVPTNADYAMEMISQRIEAGLEIKPKRRRAKSRKDSDNSDDTKSPARSLSPTGSSSNVKVDWRKWGQRAAVGKAWAVQNRIIGGNKEWPQEHNVPQTPLVPPVLTAIGRPHSPVSSHTFPCQHSKAPGLITLSPAMFFFTPLMSSHPTIIFPISYLKAVKKTGIFKGLNVKWSDPNKGDEERDETFKWVGGRDELFARLVGADASRWIRT